MGVRSYIRSLLHAVVALVSVEDMRAHQQVQRITRERDSAPPILLAQGDDYRTTPKLPPHVIRSHAARLRQALHKQAALSQGVYMNVRGRGKRSMIAVARQEMRTSNARTKKGRRNGSR